MWTSFVVLAIVPAAVLAGPFDKLGDPSVYTLPQMLQAPIASAPSEVGDFLSDVMSGKETRKLENELPLYVLKQNIIVTTKTLPNVLRAISPSIFKKYQNMTGLLKTKFNRLSKPTQAFVTKSVDEVDKGLIYYQKDLKGNFSRLNDENVARKSSIRLFKILRSIVQYMEANPKVKTEIAEQWPNYGKLFASSMYKPLKTIATIDEKQIEPLIDASYQYKLKEYECDIGIRKSC